MTIRKPIALTAVTLGALLALSGPGLDARAQPGPAAAQDSGTMQRADADMHKVLEKLMQLGAKPLGT